MRLGDTERDYYQLGSAGVTVPRDTEDAEARPSWAPDAQEDSHPGGADQ
jgi:hypothetical protein